MEVSNQKILGLTSIGRDGEEIDVVTETKKPRIYIRGRNYCYHC